MSRVTLTKLVRRFDPRIIHRDEKGEPTQVELYERPEVIEPFAKVEKPCGFCRGIMHVPQGTNQETCSDLCRKMYKKLKRVS